MAGVGRQITREIKLHPLIAPYWLVGGSRGETGHNSTAASAIMDCIGHTPGTPKTSSFQSFGTSEVPRMPTVKPRCKHVCATARRIDYHGGNYASCTCPNCPVATSHHPSALC